MNKACGECRWLEMIGKDNGVCSRMPRFEYKRKEIQACGEFQAKDEIAETLGITPEVSEASEAGFTLGAEEMKAKVLAEVDAMSEYVHIDDNAKIIAGNIRIRIEGLEL